MSILNPFFDQILNDDEQIIWSEKPQEKPFLLVTIIPRTITLIIFGIISFVFIYYFSINWFSFGNNNEDKSIPWFGFIPIFFMSFPLWMGILYPFYMLMNYKNVHYCYTNRRIILRSGAWGVDYRTIEYDQVSDLNVEVGPIGEKYNTGNLSIITGTNSEDKKITNTMYSISQPYEVFKNINRVMLDIKSDLYYPNELRPSINKGYKTEYDPK
jgi:membrane protein YdbS with pleckstrin-like domain